MSDTTVSPVIPIVTASPVSTVDNKQEVVNSIPVTTASPVDNSGTDSPAKILDGVNALCNTTLYVLTKGFYPGADAHLVNQAKEFIKEIKLDIERKRKDLVNGKPVDLGSK